MAELTVNELVKVKDTFSNVCRYVAWQLATKYNYNMQSEFENIEKLVMNSAIFAASKYKEKYGPIVDNIMFITYIKQAIWNAQNSNLEDKAPAETWMYCWVLNKRWALTTLCAASHEEQPDLENCPTCKSGMWVCVEHSETDCSECMEKYPKSAI